MNLDYLDELHEVSEICIMIELTEMYYEENGRILVIRDTCSRPCYLKNLFKEWLVK